MPTPVNNTPVTEGIPPKIIKQSEELSCELNQVEWQTRAQELADAHKTTESEKQRKKDIAAEINADVKAAEARESKLATVVATRREQREVVVEVVYNYDEGIVTKTRTDTHEEISRRDMTTQEKQSELDLTDANHFIESRHEEGQSDGLEQETNAAETPAKKGKK